MIPKIVENPTLVIAGPGAGKTHDMVRNIVDAIPYLKPNRVLAAITFTNAATDSIRERLLQGLLHVPPNIFIGTNYSFFNQFILLPFATLFNYIGIDKLFLEINVNEIVDKQLGKPSNYAVRTKVRNNLIGKLLREGKVPFEQIANISSKLMENKHIQRVVSHRIQYLFKDEFQDTDTMQLKLFDIIRKCKKTKIYSVGDPEQYILGFTYGLRGVKTPSFDDIPINRFATGCDMIKNEINKRSCEKLVEFTNNFHTCINQVSEVQSMKGAGVFFIADTNLDIIISKFIELTQIVVDSCEKNKRFFLGYTKKTFEGFIEKYGLVPISNEHGRTRSILGESLDLISSATQLSSKGIKDEYNLDDIGYRKMGIKLLKAIVLGNIRETDELIIFLNDDLGLRCQNDVINLDAKIEGLRNLIKPDKLVCQNNYYSTIHKAKGLEAECVLVVSRDQNELTKWLETDYQKRCNDKHDTCRIGYVAFTRAKQILCIACKKEIDGSVEKKLLNLKVRIVN